MPNAITLLKSDHVTAKRLLRELEATTERAVKERERLVGEIERELKIHSQIEEELFYEATEEHHVVDMVLPELKSTSPKAPEFGAKAKVLKELVEHHAQVEETEMFTKARRLLDDQQLRLLGDEMQARKETLEKMWSNPAGRAVKKLQSAAAMKGRPREEDEAP